MIRCRESSDRFSCSPAGFGMKLLGLVLVALLLGTAGLRAGADNGTGTSLPTGEALAKRAGPYVTALRWAEAARQMIRYGQTDRAAQNLQRMARSMPGLALVDVECARLAMARGKMDAARKALFAAAQKGWADAQTIAHDPAFAPLRNDERRWRNLLDRIEQNPRLPQPASVEAAPIAKGKVTIKTANLSVAPTSGLIVAHLAEPPATDQPVVGEEELGAIREKLNAWYRDGKAAGNVGDFYENRDGRHSKLGNKRLPQVTHIVHADKQQARRLGHGLPTAVVYSRPTLGNASLANRSGYFRRSLPRRAMTRARSVPVLAEMYANNQMYVIPEHKDFGEGKPDRFPANQPYLLISVGSSGSDQPHLRGLFAALAALPPRTKQTLIEQHAIAPTLQYLYRWTRKGIDGRDDYLSARAHPTAFARDAIDYERLVDEAHALTPADLPPVAALAVVEDDLATPGLDYPHAVAIEDLFTTPHAVARIWESYDRTRRYVLSAAPSRDLTGKALQYHWVLLRGSSEHVKITPRGPRGEEAVIELTWHEGLTTRKRESEFTNRVDVALFADNGRRLSAPAFFSVKAQNKQKRTYDEQGRLISWSSGGDDPALWPRRRWTDTFEYSDDGQLLGWTRQYWADKNKNPGETQQFTATGQLIVEGTLAEPRKTQPVRYVNRPIYTESKDGEREHRGYELVVTPMPKR